MNKPKLKTVLVTSILLAFVAAGGWVGYKERGQTDDTNIQISEQPSTAIEVVSIGDKKIVKNHLGGYEISIPKNWAFYQYPDQSQDSFVLFVVDANGKNICPIHVNLNKNPENFSLKQYVNNKMNSVANETESGINVIARSRSWETINGIVFYKDYLNTEEGSESLAAVFSNKNTLSFIDIFLDPQDDSCRKSFDFVLQNIKFQ